MKNSLYQFNLNKFLYPLKESKKIILAYSGGIDSSTLLYLLYTSRADIKQSIKAIHIDHGLNEKSNEWSKFCKNECEKYNITFKSIKIDEKCPKNMNIESWARDMRYSILSQNMDKNDILLTAHNQDDQIETFFLQIFRGSGPRGLSSMPEIKKIADGYHLRPYLHISRDEIKQYAKKNNLLWKDDDSNLDTTFDRNYLRHEVLPVISKTWSSYHKTICKVIDHQKEYMTLLDDIAFEDMKFVLFGDSMNLNVELIKKLSYIRQKNLIFYWLNSLKLQRPTSKHIEQIISSLIKSRSDRTPCVNWKNTEVRRYRGYLYASKISKKNDPNVEINWNTKLPLHIYGETLIAKQGYGKGISKATVKDAEITIRYRHGGEKINSNSLSQSKSVKKLFQEYGVPPWLRDKIPLIYINNQLAVVPGFCIDKKFSASANEISLEIHWSGYRKITQNRL